jgi:hypothetical protein
MNSRQYYLLTRQQETAKLLENLENQGFNIFRDNAQRSDEEALVDE